MPIDLSPAGKGLIVRTTAWQTSLQHVIFAIVVHEMGPAECANRQSLDICSAGYIVYLVWIGIGAASMFLLYRHGKRKLSCALLQPAELRMLLKSIV